MYFVMPAILAGIFFAFVAMGYGIVKYDCPYSRVAYYWTVLSSHVIVQTLSYLLLTPLVSGVLFTFSLTFLIVWITIFDHRKMVYAQYTED